MTNHIIDNTIKNLGKTVLWQYDKARRLLSVMKHMQVMYHCAVEQFWDYWITKVLSIETCDVFGCSLWGRFLGVPRPTIVDSSGKTRQIATSVYRRLLKGAFYFMKSSGTFNDIVGYLEIVFGVPGDDALSKWNAYCSEYGWTTNIDELNDKYQSNKAYPIGYVFWYDPLGDGMGSNWKCLRNITASENTSWDAIVGYVRATTESTTKSMTEDTLILRLYDPEGICRKIGGAPRNSLSISVSYKFGETTITARAERRRKCGLTLTDNGNMTMTYGKSQFYNEMHRDQRYLYEQRKAEFCPFPLGVSEASVIEHWVFGFTKVEMPNIDRYQPNRAYRRHIPGSEYSSEDSFILDVATTSYMDYLFAQVEITTSVNAQQLEEIMRNDTILRISNCLSRVYTQLEIIDMMHRGEIPDNNILGYTEDYRACYVGEVTWALVTPIRREIETNGDSYVLVECLQDIPARINLALSIIAGKANVQTANTYPLEQSNVQYQKGIAYDKGDIFGYIESSGEGYNWECLEAISAAENTSFDAIKGKLKKTQSGGPFIGELAETGRSYIDVRYLQHNPEVVGNGTPLGEATTILSIPEGTLVCGRINGMDTIFHNTTGYTFFILEDVPEDHWSRRYAKNGSFGPYYKILEGETTDDAYIEAITELLLRGNCPIVPYKTALKFQPNVRYWSACELLVDDKKMVVTPGKWSSLEEALPYMRPQVQTVLHDWYPLVIEPGRYN